MAADKQLILKPFDFVLAVKIGINPARDFLIAELAQQFRVSVSTVHGSLARAEHSKLLSRASGSMRAWRPGLKEFAIHGLKYAFPAALGKTTRGVPTAVGAPVLSTHFDQSEALVPVWPHPEGGAWGLELTPLHPAVPAACLHDPALYEVLALVDAVRMGAARERELAVAEIEARL